jgi:hypothetical protein
MGLIIPFDGRTIKFIAISVKAHRSHKIHISLCPKVFGELRNKTPHEESEHFKVFQSSNTLERAALTLYILDIIIFFHGLFHLMRMLGALKSLSFNADQPHPSVCMAQEYFL